MHTRLCFAVLITILIPCEGVAPLGGGRSVGVPGVPDRSASVQQISNGCLCSAVGCGCANGLRCANDGLCYPCQQLDCRTYGVSGCSCGVGTTCASTGTCTSNPPAVPSTCAGLSCIQGQGNPIWNGQSCQCQCAAQYSGTLCNQCAYGFTSYPACTVSSTCASTYCQNNGAAYWTSGGCSCLCSTGFSGTLCNTCAPGYAGYPSCSTTTSQTCSTLSCQNHGSGYFYPTQNRCICNCNVGFAGTTCGTCAAGYTGYPNCAGPVGGPTSCSNVFCLNNGQAHWNGAACQCLCKQGYGGATCGECASGFTGYPTCVVSGPGWTLATPVPTTSLPNTYILGQCSARNGAGITGNPYKTLVGSTAERCCDSCRQEAPTCVGWNFKGTNCMLFHVLGGTATNDPSITSGSPLVGSSTSSDDDDNLLLILGLVGLGLLLCCMLLCLLYWLFFRKKSEQREQKEEPQPVFDAPPPPVSRDDYYYGYTAHPTPQAELPPSSDGLEVSVHDESIRHDPGPVNPITQDFPQQQSPSVQRQHIQPQPLLTRQNAEFNDFMHRRDGTFA